MKDLYAVDNCLNCSLKCFGNYNIDDNDKKKLNDSKREISYKRGETIIKQGSYANNQIFIKQGLVKIAVEGVNRKVLIVDILPSNNFLSFPATQPNSYYPFTSVALKNTSVCMMQNEIVFSLSEQYPEINNELMHHYENSFRHLYNKLTITATKNMHGRLASALLIIDNERFSHENIYQHITRREIAEFAGMSQESMVKIMQELKSDKIISVNGKSIVINDYEMLRRLRKIG